MQDVLRHGDDPPLRAAPSTRESPAAKDPCLKCLNGEKSRHKHNPAADNCILYGYGVDKPTPAKARRLLLEQEIALARDEARTAAAALSSSTSTSPPPTH